MRFLLLAGMLFLGSFCAAQSDSEVVRFLSKVNRTDRPPEGLLASRSIVLHDSDFTQQELEEIQKGFQPLGVDPVSYAESELVLAGWDLIIGYGRYFQRRDIKFLIFLQKDKEDFQLTVLPFSGNSNWTAPGQSAWYVHSGSLRGLREIVHRALISSQKRENFLVNDYPERTAAVTGVRGDRNENWAPNVHAQRIAIPRFGDPAADKDLEAYLKSNVKAKYELVEPNATDQELADKGFVYVLRYLHAPGSIAKRILGYDMSVSESALVSVTYPNANLQLKTIASGAMIYKFYLRNIEYESYYLGLKWDADVTWQEALKNHFDGYKSAGRMY